MYVNSVERGTNGEFHMSIPEAFFKRLADPKKQFDQVYEVCTYNHGPTQTVLNLSHFCMPEVRFLLSGSETVIGFSYAEVLGTTFATKLATLNHLTAEGALELAGKIGFGKPR